MKVTRRVLLLSAPALALVAAIPTSAATVSPSGFDDLPLGAIYRVEEVFDILNQAGCSPSETASAFGFHSQEFADITSLRDSVFDLALSFEESVWDRIDHLVTISEMLERQAIQGNMFTIHYKQHPDSGDTDLRNIVKSCKGNYARLQQTAKALEAEVLS